MKFNTLADMKKSTKYIVTIASAGLLISIGAGFAGRMNSPATSQSKEESLKAANAKFYSSINTMLSTGNADSFSDVWSHRDNASNFGPSGNRQVGWKAIDAEFKREGAMKMGGSVTCEDMVVIVDTDGDTGYITCVEVGNNMTIDGKTSQVKFRSTNIYRMEGAQWKMVHHHTDVAQVMQDSASSKAK